MKKFFMPTTFFRQKEVHFVTKDDISNIKQITYKLEQMWVSKDKVKDDHGNLVYLYEWYDIEKVNYAMLDNGLTNLHETKILDLLFNK